MPHKRWVLQLEAVANAKVNLFLGINGKREDGFHELETVFQEISLCDDLAFERVPDGINVRMEPEIFCPLEENLVYRAAALFKESHGINDGVRINVRKRIPPGAGLGGGSSNAACTLKSMARIFKPDINEDALMKMAERLGSDAPFFIKGGIAAAKGKGEILTPIKMDPHFSFHMVIVCPPFSISTKWAYDQWDKERQEIKSPAMAVFLEGLNGNNLGKRLFNDFEPLVIRKYPIVREIKHALLDCGAEGALLSGSGSAVFGIFSTEEAASEAMIGLSRFGKTFFAEPVRDRQEV